MSRRRTYSISEQRNPLEILIRNRGFPNCKKFTQNLSEIGAKILQIFMSNIFNELDLIYAYPNFFKKFLNLLNGLTISTSLLGIKKLTQKAEGSIF